MNTRKKITLVAPDGVTESIIEGTYYWPDEAGEVSTTNDGHAKILVRHGYTKTGEVSMMPPASVRGAIDCDELGRQGLAQALEDRGLSFPANGSRAELAEIAEAWNGMRRRARGGTGLDDAPKAAPVPAAPQAAVQAPAAPAATTLPAAPAEAPAAPAPAAPAPAADSTDFQLAGYDELKGWLTARAVAYPHNSTKAALREMCIAVHADILAKAAAKSAAA